MSIELLLGLTVAGVAVLLVLVIALFFEVFKLRGELNNARDRIIDIWVKTGCEL